jgi:tellurite resistance protein
MQLPHTNTFSYKKCTDKLAVFIFFALIFISLDALARAGGGGGGGSSSSGGDGGGAIMALYYLVRLIFLLPFPFNVIVIAVIIFLIYLYYKNSKESSALNTLSSLDKKIYNQASVSPLVESIPGFDQPAFYKKVDGAFYKIQEAWQQKNLKSVRQFISDGVYQRFEAQFLMMNALEQSNTLSDVTLHERLIVSAENDGNFYILHVRLSASNTDNFESKRFKQLNSGGYESYTEYWTFVKKVGAQSGKDIYSSSNCPNCGSSIENKLGEVSKCGSCGTQINNGDYDWVLSEITQPEEFASNFNQLKNRGRFYDRLKTKGYKSPEFSPQYIEDKASNAYLQIKIAQALADQKRINRFCSNRFTEKTKTSFTQPHLYNRLYTKDVSLINIYEDSANIFAALSISCVQQKVAIENNKLQLINASPVSVNEYLVLSRSKTFEPNKYSAMAHNCVNCGAPVEDSLQLTCNFCGSALNDNNKDWIVENLMSLSEYNSYKQGFSSSVNSPKQEQKLGDSNWDVRDFALNNMMVVAMADGVMQDEERLFLLETAKDLGYSTKKITELFDQVKTSGLALKMPDDMVKREKVIKLMNRVANADGDFNDKEKAVLAEAENMAG